MLKKGWTFYIFAIVLGVISLIVVPSQNMFDPAGDGVVAFVGTLIGVLALLIGFGLDVTETPLGILQSGRNTYSLSRLQMVLWTWIILSGLLAVAACRAAGLGGGAVSTALNIVIAPELLQVMGISYFSAVAAPSLLALKAQSPSTANQITAASGRLGSSLTQTGQVVSRRPDESPVLADILQGDDLATAGVVDLSKVQQLLITLLLVGIYLVMLLALFSNLGGTGKLDSLPKFDEHFVYLLAISHGGYLAYKAAPRTNAAAPATPTSRPAPPDRNAP